ncbi:MAG: DinB family protein [Acidobacteriota bacterium]|nr:DinB family protein [Acidobacteriota bacterium]
MFRRWNFLVVLSVVVMFAPAALAQRPSAPQNGAAMAAPGPEDSVLAAWNDVGDRLITMAKDFPADKYDYKPTPEVRSFAEILLHVAAVDKFVVDAANGQKTGTENLPRSQYNTKEKVVQAITEAVHEGASMMRREGNQGMLKAVNNPFGGKPIALIAFTYEIVEHSGEHYGNLVTYYRLNHLVPPASRPQPKR